MSVEERAWPEALETILAWPGIWRGRGINHEGEPFDAVLAARPLIAGRSILFWFEATGDDGTRFHEEVALIGPAADGGLALVSANSNVPFLQGFTVPAESEETGAAEFHHGQIEREDMFRETIRIAPEDSKLRLIFSWAMPPMTSFVQSEVILSRSDESIPDQSPLR